MTSRTRSGFGHLTAWAAILVGCALVIVGCRKEDSSSAADQAIENGSSPEMGMSGEGMGAMHESAGSRVDTGADIANEPLQPTSGMRVYEMGVTGMTCSGCANTISSALRPMPGVHAVRISLANNLCWVMVDRDGPDASAVIDAIRKAGYTAEMKKTMTGDSGDGAGDGAAGEGG